MGSGGSRHLQIVQPRVNVTPFSNHPENPMHIASQPEMLQEQRSSDDSEDESNEESSSQEDVEWDVSHTDTLKTYTKSYPEQAEVFQQMLENMQVLRNTMNSSTRSDRYSDQVLVVFRNIAVICHDINTSTATEASTKMRVMDFVVEIEAAELLQRFAQNYFKVFYEMSAEQDDDNSSSEDESWKFVVFLYLRRVLGAILNLTDLHDGFC